MIGDDGKGSVAAAREPAFLTIRQVAERIAVSVRTVYRLIADRELPQPVRVRGCSRIPQEDVAAYVAKLKRERVQ